MTKSFKTTLLSTRAIKDRFDEDGMTIVRFFKSILVRMNWSWI